MFTSPYALALSSTERTELEAMARSRVLAAGLAQRARVILAIADGEPYSVLGARVNLSTTTLTRWRKRFERQRLAGLHDAARGGRGDRLSPALEAKTSRSRSRHRPNRSRTGPPDGSRPAWGSVI